MTIQEPKPLHTQNFGKLALHHHTTQHWPSWPSFSTCRQGDHKTSHCVAFGGPSTPWCRCLTFYQKGICEKLFHPFAKGLSISCEVISLAVVALILPELRGWSSLQVYTQYWHQGVYTSDVPNDVCLFQRCSRICLSPQYQPIVWPCRTYQQSPHACATIVRLIEQIVVPNCHFLH